MKPSLPNRERFAESFDSPIWVISVFANATHLEKIEFDAAEFEAPNSVTRLAIAQIKRYFNNTWQGFSVPLAFNGTPFQNTVWQTLKTIPYGTTIAYLDLALKVGDKKAVRAVASANGQNPFPIILPCHRVVGTDGSLTGYLGGLDKKRWLLQHEGAIAKDLFS